MSVFKYIVKTNNVSILDLSYKMSEVLAADLYLLESVLNIAIIGFLRIYYNNNFFYSCSDKRLIQNYYTHIKDTNIFFKDLLLDFEPKETFILWPDKPDHYSMDIYLTNRYWHGITLMRNTTNYVDLWWMASQSHNTECNYITCAEFIKRYIKHLKKQCDYFLEQFESLTLPSFVKLNFDNIGIIQKKKEDILTLSLREQSCLSLIKKGYSVKQIALELKISVTTVNTYILRLKQKMNLLYKSEFVNLFEISLF